MSAQSAGCFIPTAFVRYITWGYLAHYNLGMGREIAAIGCKVRIWEEDDHVLISD